MGTILWIFRKDFFVGGPFEESHVSVGFWSVAFVFNWFVL